MGSLKWVYISGTQERVWDIVICEGTQTLSNSCLKSTQLLGSRAKTQPGSLLLLGQASPCCCKERKAGAARLASKVGIVPFLRLRDSTVDENAKVKC